MVTVRGVPRPLRDLLLWSWGLHVAGLGVGSVGVRKGPLGTTMALLSMAVDTGGKVIASTVLNKSPQ